MIFAILMLALPTILGAWASYFAPAKLSVRTVLRLSIAVTVAGTFLFFFSDFCIRQLEETRFRGFVLGITHTASTSVIYVDWVGLWMDFCLAGVFLVIFGLSAFVGCGMRKFTGRYADELVPPS